MKNWSDIKIIVLGKSGTNKTQFVNKWKGNEINEENKATIVSEFGFKLFENEGKLYRVQLWDLAGCDINYMIIKSFGKDADGVVVMSCAANIITREDSIKWKRSVDDIFEEGEEIPCILVENNVDLLPDNDHNDPTFEDFYKNNGFIKGFRASSKTGENVNEAMNFLIKNIINRREEKKEKEINDKSEHTSEMKAVFLNEEMQGSFLNKYKKKIQKSCT